MKNNTEKFLMGAGIAAAGLAAIGVTSYCVTKKLVKIALDRETPKNSEKSSKKLSGSIMPPDALETWAEYAARLEGCGAETVEIESHDGKKLIGHLRTCENPKRIIIAMHGWRSSWTKDFCMIADFWHNNNCNVLYADQRGQGKSEGDYMGFGLTERHDCLDWINWANENLNENLPIYLAGVSMGATTVLMAAGLKLPENIHGIMADCGFTSPNEIWRHVAQDNLHIPYGGITASLADGMCRKKIQIGSKDYSTVDALKTATVPVLFVHGTDDRFVPIEMTYENYKACASPKRLLVVPGAGHGMSYLTDKADYEKTVKDFWAEFD